MNTGAVAPPSARPGILDYFPSLDKLLREAVARARQLYNAGDGDAGFHGLYISEQEVDALVNRADSVGSAESAASFLETCAVLPGIEGFSARWQLTAFEHAVMLLALAPHVDLRYERIYAYLQDDVTRRKPTVDLVLSLLSADPRVRIQNRARLAAGAPLLRSGLIRLVPDPSHVEPPLLSHYLVPDESAVRMLLGDPEPDPRLSAFCRTESEVASPELNTDVLRRLPPFVALANKQGRSVRLLFSGPSTGEKASAAAVVAAALKTTLLTADLSKNPAWKTDPVSAASLLAREACRTSAVLHLEGIDGTGEATAFQTFFDCILQHNGVVSVASESTAVAAALNGLRFLTIPFALPGYETRLARWQIETAAAGLYADESTISTLANNFVQPEEEIAAAVESARQSLEWKAAANQRPSPDDIAGELMRAAREQSGVELASLTSKLKPVYHWSDIVLPADSLEQLREICQRVAHSHDVLESGGFGKKLSAGKGVAVLFAGPSGTGKTMAAEVVANQLGLDLYRIDLSTVVSKYIGETEKNLERIFSAATRSNSVLLFDEADALCGKRSEVRDAHDRYANIEISYLLQKMEQYEGITILTTNLRGNLDEAFVRRLAFTVHFPFPDETDRLRIWQQIWPPATQFDPQLSFAALAKHFKLSGGNIKNIALSTAFLAATESRPVRMSDVLHATRREYEKVGKVMSEVEMEAVVR
jgi:hypothetical protein